MDIYKVKHIYECPDPLHVLNDRAENWKLPNYQGMVYM